MESYSVGIVKGIIQVLDEEVSEESSSLVALLLNGSRKERNVATNAECMHGYLE